jgi:hypothetical protein
MSDVENVGEQMFQPAVERFVQTDRRQEARVSTDPRAASGKTPTAPNGPAVALSVVVTFRWVCVATLISTLTGCGGDNNATSDNATSTADAGQAVDSASHVDGAGTVEDGSGGGVDAPGSTGDALVDAGSAHDGAVSSCTLMPLISRGLPILASYGNNAASAATDADYNTYWDAQHAASASDANWLAIDVSSVPATQRSRVYSLWWAEWDSFNYVENGAGGSYGIPGDYQIQASADPGSGGPPTTGWQTLVTGTANQYNSGADILDLSSAHWIRIFVTAGASTNQTALSGADDTKLQWDLHDAHACNDGWKFSGDSISCFALPHVSGGDAFDQLVNASSPSYPAFQNASHGGWRTQDEINHIAAFLQNFPGRYYALPLGSNDATQVDDATFKQNMTTLIEAILAAGKVPVIPTIPYHAGADTAVQGLNAQIRALYQAYPQVIPGPDLYTLLFDGAATMFTPPDLLHPNAVGLAAMRKAWADAMLKEVYGVASSPSDASGE